MDKEDKILKVINSDEAVECLQINLISRLGSLLGQASIYADISVPVGFVKIIGEVENNSRLFINPKEYDLVKDLPAKEALHELNKLLPLK